MHTRVDEFSGLRTPTPEPPRRRGGAFDIIIRVGLATSAFAIAALTHAGASATPEPTSVALVESAEPRAVIVTAAKPAGAVPYAVGELREHVRQITGTSLPHVETETVALEEIRHAHPGATVVLIGRSALTDALGIKPPEAVDGSRLVVREGLVAVVGRDDIGFSLDYSKGPTSCGTLYGVYELLHRLGVRWYFPEEEGTVLPDADTLRLTLGDTLHAPRFPYRFVSYGQEMQWLRRIGAGGDRNPWATRHTFETTIDFHKRFGETRPEWFSVDRSGGRTHGVAFAHAGVIPAIVEAARGYFTSSWPEGLRRYFLVIPADGTYYCHCDICTPQIERSRGDRGDMSNYVARAAVEVADAIRAEFPDKRIVYCAYSNYKLPPTDVDKLPANLEVLIAEARHRLVTPEAKREAYQLLRDWQALEPNAIYFCRYYNNTLGTVPKVMHSLIRDDIRQIAEIANAGPSPVLGEMNFGPSSPDIDSAWWNNLNLYVTARFLWDPQTDLDALLDDFCLHYYGPAAKPMRAFWARGDKLFEDPSQRARWSAESIGAMDDLLGQAIDAVAPDSIYRRRLSRIDEGFKTLRALRLRLVEPSNPSDLDAGLASWFGFEGGHGQTVRDHIRGTRGEVSRATVTQGRHGQALQLAGEFSGVRIEPVKVSDAYTVEAWIRPSRTIFDGAYSILDGGVGDRFSFHIHDARLQLWHHSGEPGWAGGERFWNTPAQDFRPGHWYHVAGTFSREHGMTLYVNGEMIAIDMTKTRPSAYPIAVIGARDVDASDRSFPGAIDEVRIYQRELSPAEVRARYDELVGHDPRPEK